MKNYHPYTGEVIICKACDAHAEVFVSGLYPFCAVHGRQVVDLTKNGFKLFEAMKQVRESNLTDN